MAREGCARPSPARGLPTGMGRAWPKKSGTGREAGARSFDGPPVRRGMRINLPDDRYGILINLRLTGMAASCRRRWHAEPIVLLTKSFIGPYFNENGHRKLGQKLKFLNTATNSCRRKFVPRRNLIHKNPVGSRISPLTRCRL